MHIGHDIAPLVEKLPLGGLYAFSSYDVEEKSNVVNLDKLMPLVVDVVCTYVCNCEFIYVTTSIINLH